MSLNERNDVMKLREHESALRILRGELSRAPMFAQTAARLVEHHTAAIVALRQRLNAQGKAA